MGDGKRGAGWVLLGLLPLLGLGALLALVVLKGAGVDREDRPPVEELTVERVALPAPHEIVVYVRNGGPEPVTVSQVAVNEALWDFEAEPERTITPLRSAEITLPYSWVEGEAYEIELITSTGATFAAEVPVAVLTPGFSAGTLGRYALIGLYVGVIPVSLGLLWYPFLRRMGASGMNFVLALTVGLLVFLVLDTLLDAMEIAGRLPGVFSGVPLVLSAALLALLGLLGTERLFRRGREGAGRLSTSYRIALGIGLHNLGEGLAIGAAFALGEAALGAFLVVGFTLHNVTEGVGIAAPVLKGEGPRPAHFAGLALLGGGPAILGTWIGGFAYSNLASSVFLAVGAGAILQVVYEVGRLLLEDSVRAGAPVLSAPNLAGFAAGMAVMYATALLVSV
ncbi:putative metal cation transporter [Rubrobacter xylanophilus DSM 9941]|uniref:Putative metal cation transporter n=1 Tax=Rubrobacter xylanophilus (strain DSM 9941 / JCM 11954 / NBRC 16129 / PRD-1) TaxID=266117 RepID=Q1AZW3_RUBXD|nr:metal transporter [Rubrobacter xylanophilus]ABG03065.1 putative metal cation transporter [Rubrobacter xylanophilus DSM 9941]